MRAMMAHVGLHENPNSWIWPEYAVTSNKLEKFMVNPYEEKGT